jgi:hypothetical protein
MNRESPKYYRRYWILSVLRAAMLSGAGTVSSDRFHRLVYFVNALLPAVGLDAETARVLKASYGPFFPEYQWDLDRLVGTGLVSVVDLRWVSSDQRFFGKYRITPDGINRAEKIAAATPFLSDVEYAISEIVSAFIATPDALSALATHIDANFGQDTIRDGQIVDFGEWQAENFSKNAAEFLLESWLSNLFKRRTGEQPTRISVGVAPAISPQSHTIFQDTKSAPNASVQSEYNFSASNYKHKRSFHLYVHYLVQSLGRQASPLPMEV